MHRLSGGYAWHQAIWQAFPERAGQSRQFLFRVDSSTAAFRIYVLSLWEPTPPVWGEWKHKPVAPSFLEHQNYRFQLKANPTLRQSDTRRRVGLYAEDKLRAWIMRKADQHGFTMDQQALVVGSPTDEMFVKKGRRGKHVSVDFEGTITVHDRDIFTQAFEKGIGSAKGFGFGLLMLQPSMA